MMMNMQHSRGRTPACSTGKPVSGILYAVHQLLELAILLILVTAPLLAVLV
jgi:hypothetical protein